MTENKTWICEVDEEGVLTFPDELVKLQDWKEGDDINFDILPDGTLILTKIEPDEVENSQGEHSKLTLAKVKPDEPKNNQGEPSPEIGD